MGLIRGAPQSQDTFMLRSFKIAASDMKSSVTQTHTDSVFEEARQSYQKEEEEKNDGEKQGEWESI